MYAMFWKFDLPCKYYILRKFVEPNNAYCIKRLQPLLWITMISKSFNFYALPIFCDKLPKSALSSMHTSFAKKYDVLGKILGHLFLLPKNLTNLFIEV